MVSVKRFVQDEPALFKASQEFVCLFASSPDPIVHVVCKAKAVPPTVRIAWMLLGTVLFQNRSYPEIVALLTALYKKFPAEKLWTLPVPGGKEIEAVVEETFGSRNWNLFENVAGIFLSVGMFGVGAGTHPGGNVARPGRNLLYGKVEPATQGKRRRLPLTRTGPAWARHRLP